MRRPRPAVIVLIASCALLAGSVAVIAAAGPNAVSNVGSRDAVTASTTASPASTAAAPGSDLPTGAGTPSESSQSPATASSASPTATPMFPSTRVDATKPLVREKVPAPVRIEIPAISVDAPVDAIGVDDRGRVAVPEDVRRTGWYKWGPAPGASTGSAMITGHVDGVDQGAGEFYELSRLDVDDEVRVHRADGSVMRYRVIARETFNKSVVPLEQVFARSGPHRLTLVTCGGPFDSQTLVYTDNVVVTAVPI